MFIICMGTEKSVEVSLPIRVDINDLLNRARKVREKENRAYLVFVGLGIILILIVAIILSF